MAFHPFKHFRKHQKVYLAALTIVTMILFIFSFGGGGADPFQRVLTWIGMSSHRGDPVIDLYGKTVHTDELAELRYRRQLASEFMMFGITSLEKAVGDIDKKYGEKQRKEGGPPELPTPVQTALSQRKRLLDSLPAVPPEQRGAVMREALTDMQRQLALVDPQNQRDQYNALDTLVTDLSLRAWFTQRKRDDSYFGGTPKTEDLLDFLVWKHQAEKMGVVLTSADVVREVNRAWGNTDHLKPDVRFDSIESVRVFFNVNSRIHKKLGPADLLAALTDEYRVCLAKQAVLGYASGVREYRERSDGIHYSPSAVTPDEFWEYFKRQRTTLAVSFLPVAVKDFVPKVKAQPSETDLQNLFARYKEDEPSPTRRQPGFKEPRRVKIEYFSYRPDGPFARKLAAQATEQLPAFRVGLPAAPYAAGGWPAWAARVAQPADLDVYVSDQYTKYRQEEAARALKFDRDDASTFRSNGRFGQGVDPTAWRTAEVQPVAAAVGQLFGNAGTGTPSLAVAGAYLGATEVYERAAATAVASLFLAVAGSPSPFVALTVPTRYLHSARPPEEVRGQMVERFQKSLAGPLMEANVRRVREEMDKLLAARNEEKLDASIKKAVAEHGLESAQSMAAPQSRHEIEEHPDPALEQLREAYEKSDDNPFPDSEQNRPSFLAMLFHRIEPSPEWKQREQFMEQQRKQLEQAMGMKFPEQPKMLNHSRTFRSSSGDVVWVFWRAEDKPAYVPRIQSVRQKVKDAWYLEQARKLAREEARRIDKELKQQHANAADAVKFLREQKTGKVFELSNVAHLIAPFNSSGRPLLAGDYRPYAVPKTEIAHPPADFVDQLLKLKEPGDSLVLADRPARHFYVAVLREKPQVPDRREFFEVYNARGQDNPIWSALLETRQDEYARKLTEQLRAEATKKLEGGEYVLPEKLRGESVDSGDSGL